MNARTALPLMTLVTALSWFPSVQCKAASMSVSGQMSGDSMVANSNDLLHENGSHTGSPTDNSGRRQAIHPQLKPDYPCQNLHVREPTCPPR
jgi:hypothetical protein